MTPLMTSGDTLIAERPLRQGRHQGHQGHQDIRGHQVHHVLQGPCAFIAHDPDPSRRPPRKPRAWLGLS